MTYEPAYAAVFRQRLLTHPGERQDVDYKSSMVFGTDDSFSLKLIRHIQGMANAGGGWLVIGFVETDDKSWMPDPSHSNEICSSYDPTRLSQQVDSSMARGQRVRVTVHLEVHPGSGLQHPMIRVEGFERLPCICRSNRTASDTGEQILRQGAAYLRRPGAETAPVSTPQDWEDLINRCLRLRRDEFVTEFRELFERMTSPSQPPRSATEELSAWIDQMRNEAFEITGGREGRRTTEPQETGHIESGQRLVQPAGHEWRQHVLLEAAERAELRNTGWPIGLVIHSLGLAPVATPDGIEARIGHYSKGQVDDFWSLRNDASYYVSRLFEEDFESLWFTTSEGHPERSVWFDNRIWRIAEVILHSASLYRELGIAPNEPYALAVNHRGLEAREFYVSTPRRFVTRGRICRSPAATWMREVTQDYVTSNLKSLVGEVASGLFVLFDFAQVSQEVINAIVDEFLSSRL